MEIAWQLNGETADERFTISWIESGGPPVAAPSQRGFGSTVIKSMTELSLDGEVQLDFAPSGLIWRLSCPATRILKSRHVIGNANMNKRVLVVEDDAMIALDIARELTDAGLEVVGPAISVAKALRLIGDYGCDAAVLDVNLGNNETSEPVARELRARSTPFVVLSGYSSEQHPPGLPRRARAVETRSSRYTCCRATQMHGRSLTLSQGPTQLGSGSISVHVC